MVEKDQGKNQKLNLPAKEVKLDAAVPSRCSITPTAQLPLIYLLYKRWAPPTTPESTLTNMTNILHTTKT